MSQKRAYDLLRLDLLFLKAEDVVRTSSQFVGGEDTGEDSGTKLPPDFD